MPWCPKCKTEYPEDAESCALCNAKLIEQEPSGKRQTLIEYCVDEAGDSVLWGRHGKPLVGTDGCSKYFILGMVYVKNPEKLQLEALVLRKELLEDPYFDGVPSLDPAKRRTAVAFHAKDDPAEVRHKFFKLLMQHDIEFHAVVRAKLEIMRIVSEFRKSVNKNYIYDQNQLYDAMAGWLFGDKLHNEDAYSITFARRGKSNRTKALRDALVKARSKHCESNSIIASANIEVQAAYPKDRVELQAADYFLWAMQRAYEKGEDRFVRMLWPQIHCVWDYDDKREDKAGVRYTKEKPLDAASILRYRQ